VYYQLLFGLKIPLVPGLSPKLTALAMHQGRGDAPVPGEIWEAQYRSGDWSFLRELDQMTRYSVIAGYVQTLKCEGSVLDVGCGEGLLLDRLCGGAYSKFVGIDISQTAIERAQEKQYPRSFFTRVDARGFVADEHFDAIIFNEVLYYFRDPLEVSRKYCHWLKPDGLLITSLYGGSDRARAIARSMKKEYRSIDEVEIINHGKKWIIDVFLPEIQRSLPGGKTDGS
jgi:2-polyprenyl-3-methyl-5-hydroxy-6-metoxy-1,4-benzoquinol methylase